MSDLPQPGTPRINIPFGWGNPYSLALSVKALERWVSQVFNSSKPPTESMVSSSSMYSKIPLRRMSCFFSDKTMSTSSSVNRPVVTCALR